MKHLSYVKSKSTGLFVKHSLQDIFSENTNVPKWNGIFRNDFTLFWQGLIFAKGGAYQVPSVIALYYVISDSICHRAKIHWRILSGAIFHFQLVSPHFRWLLTFFILNFNFANYNCLLKKSSRLFFCQLVKVTKIQSLFSISTYLCFQEQF